MSGHGEPEQPDKQRPDKQRSDIQRPDIQRHDTWRPDIQFPESRQGGPRDPERAAPLPWSNDSQDPEAGPIGEGWTALDQLIRTAELTRFDAAAQARLVRAVAGRSRRRAAVGWGLALAAAAAVLFMLSLRNDTPVQIAGGSAPPAAPHSPGSPNTVSPNSASPSSVSPSSASPNTGPQKVAPSQATPPETIELAAEFWSDSYVADIESARFEAQEVELSWRRDSEPLAELRQRFDELQADWNDRAL